MTIPEIENNRRILIIDDNASIHADFQKILGKQESSGNDLSQAASALLGSSVSAPQKRADFELTSAFQGQEGLAEVRQAVGSGRPFAMAFVDVRMPPGWDGIETTARLWEADPDLQVVICTAYSDYSWDDMSARLNTSDRLVILKKPFDLVEVLQLAHALTTKWLMTQRARWRVNDLDRMVSQRTADLASANQKLQEQQRVLSTLMGNLPGMAYRCHADSERTMEFLSDGCLGLTGYAPSDLTWNRKVAYGTIIHTEDRPAVQAQIQAALAARRKYQLTYRITTAGAVERWVWEQGMGVADADGKILALEGFITDISERKRLEQQVRQAQKLEAVGQLAGGVAHYFNNLLTVILGNAELVLTSRTAFGISDKESLREISAAAGQAASLTQQLVAFSRQQVMQTRPCDVNEVVCDLPRRTRPFLREGVHFQCRYGLGLPSVEADGSMIEQALTHLVANAIDAMPQGGGVLVTTEKSHFDAADVEGRTDARAGDFVCITVTDTGRGILPEHLPHMFEPFFTTKDVGKGTGLGLATVYGIAKQHGGWVTVSSEVGKGSTFKLFLPVADGSASRWPKSLLARMPLSPRDRIQVAPPEELEDIGLFE